MGPTPPPTVQIEFKSPLKNLEVILQIMFT